MRFRRRPVAFAAGAIAFTAPSLSTSSAQAFTGTAQAKGFEPTRSSCCKTRR
jgi:hypothetical protein